MNLEKKKKKISNKETKRCNCYVYSYFLTCNFNFTLSGNRNTLSNPPVQLSDEVIQVSETSDKLSPFEDLLLNQLNGLMALVLTTAVLKNDVNLDQNELKYQIAERNGRAKEAVRGEVLHYICSDNVMISIYELVFGCHFSVGDYHEPAGA